jgi:hypothetical protein
MIDKKLRIEVALDDFASGNLQKIKSQFGSLTNAVDSQSTSYVKHGKSVDATTEYMKKFEKQAKKMMLGFVGFTVVKTGIDAVAKSIVDAGLNTDQWKKTTGELSATIGAELLPDVQALVDVMSGDSGLKSVIKVLRTIVSGFKEVDVALLWLTSGAEFYLSLLPGKGKKHMEALSKATMEEAIKMQGEINKAMDFSNIDIKPPVKKKEKEKKGPTPLDKSKEEVYKNIVDQNYAESQIIFEAEQEREKQLSDMKFTYAESVIALNDNQNQRELQGLLLKQEQEMLALGENNQAKLILADAHTNQIIALEKTQTDREKEESKKRIDQAREESFQKAELAVSMGQQFAQTLSMVAQASGKNAEEMRGIRVMGAIMDGAAAEVAMLRSVWSSSKNYYEGIAASVAMTAMIGAQTAAQVAMISNAKYALGGDFVTSGPRMIMVGDNPGGRERVSVEPLSSSNVNGPKGGQPITVNFYDNSGALTDSVYTELRSGRGNKLIDEIVRRVRA